MYAACVVLTAAALSGCGGSSSTAYQSPNNQDSLVLSYSAGLTPTPIIQEAAAGSFQFSPSLVGTQYTITPSSTTFSNAMSVIIYFTTADIPPGSNPANFTIAEVSNGTWVALTGAIVDLGKGTVTIDGINKSGTYSIWN